MIDEPSKFKSHYADKIMQEIHIAKLKTTQEARINESEKRSAEEKKDERIDLVHKKISLLKYL